MCDGRAMYSFEIVMTAIGALVALTANRISRAQYLIARAAEQERLRSSKIEEARRYAMDRRVAIAEYQPLWTREMIDIIHGANPTAADIKYVSQTVAFCDIAVALGMSPHVKLDKDLQEAIPKLISPASAFLEQNGELRDTSAIDAKLGQKTPTDRTKYSWNGEGKNSKIWTINLIAQRWKADNKIESLDAFIESFGAELCAAVAQRATEFDQDFLLTQDAKANNLQSLGLKLDDEEYGVHWRCGFKNSRVGFEVHRPIIDHFRAKHGYPAEPIG